MNSQFPILTSVNITQPMPNVAEAVAPPYSQTQCSQWAAINGWIGQNTGAAVAILLVGAFLMWKVK